MRVAVEQPSETSLARFQKTARRLVLGLGLLVITAGTTLILLGSFVALFGDKAQFENRGVTGLVVAFGGVPMLLIGGYLLSESSQEHILEE
jgi:hypothetical protein